jgi:hypothetical protein
VAQLFEREQELERSGGGAGSVTGVDHKSQAATEEALRLANEAVARLELAAFEKDQEIARLTKALEAYVPRICFSCGHPPPNDLTHAFVW